MKRWGCIGLICIAVCAGAITLARRIGSTQVSPLAVIFTNPDGTPCPDVCLFGAQPGKTTYQEAILLVQQHPFTRALQRRESGNELISLFESQTSDFKMHITKSKDNDVLAWIMLENINPNLRQVSSATGTLGQMISLLGPPTAVYAGDLVITDTYYAATRTTLLSVRADSGDSVPISLDDSTLSIVLSTPGQFGDMAVCCLPQLKQWRGFRPVGSYRAAPPVDLSR
jgi:hypothetical protein